MNKFKRNVFHNRDIKYKISLINHVQYIFDINQINEKVVRVLPTEYFNSDFSELRIDFAVECESGNIYDVECETLSVNDETVDKTWKYVKELYSRYDNDIYSLIIALSENNTKPVKKIGTTTHKPLLCEMKKFNGDKYLNNIKNKFKAKKELTNHDCAIIELIPDMKTTKDTATVVEEICLIIKEGNIHLQNRIKLQATMWLNIDYYIKNKEKRKELMEMIDVEQSQESEFFKWQDEFGKYKEQKGIEKGIEKGKEDGIKKGKEDIIIELLKSMSPEEIADKINVPLSQIKKLASKQS